MNSNLHQASSILHMQHQKLKRKTKVQDRNAVLGWSDSPGGTWRCVKITLRDHTQRGSTKYECPSAYHSSVVCEHPTVWCKCFRDPALGKGLYFERLHIDKLSHMVRFLWHEQTWSCVDSEAVITRFEGLRSQKYTFMFLRRKMCQWPVKPPDMRNPPLTD